MAAPTASNDFEQYLRDEPAPPPHPALVLPPAQLAGRIQHTLVGQAITEREVREHVRETLTHGFDAAIVPPSWVWAARDEMRGTTGRVGSFIDYPHGNGTTAGRVAEAKALVDAGVDELDSTVNIGYLLSSRYDEFAADIAAVVEAASPIGVKVMLELPLLNPRQRERCVQAAIDAGVAFVKNASRGAVGIADPSTISLPAGGGSGFGRGQGGRWHQDHRAGPGGAGGRRRPGRNVLRCPNRHRWRPGSWILVFLLSNGRVAWVIAVRRSGDASSQVPTVVGAGSVTIVTNLDGR